MRSIIVVRTPAVPASPSTDDPQAATPSLVGLGLKSVEGATISPKAPVRVPSVSATDMLMYESLGNPPPLNDVAYEVEFEDEEARRRYLEANAAVIVSNKAHSNPPLRKLGTVCPKGAIGSHEDVASHMAFTALHADNRDGRGVRIAIVDDGVNRFEVPISGGLKHEKFPPPGEGPAGHGTMVASDARLAAPGATFLDYPLLEGPHTGDGQVGPLLFDALTVYEALLADYLAEDPRRPMVVINSWGIGGGMEDDTDSEGQFSSSHPDHKFNLAVGALVAAGADVLFAAGNCGGPCGFSDCPAEQRGPGNGILGANSHEQVITVGAVSLEDDVLGYSSQGPGQMTREKPDILASSHFEGPKAIDTGTSAACGVAGGIVAALRSKPSARDRTPREVKDALRSTARQINGFGPGWNPESGHGVINATKAAQQL
jgi:hypothetical protein